MTKIGELAARSRAAGIRLQALDDAIVESAAPADREQVRLAMRLRGEFSPYLHTVFDAVEWCSRRESESDDEADKIIGDAAKEFARLTPKTRKEFAESLQSAWVRKDWKAFNRLKRQRKDTG